MRLSKEQIADLITRGKFSWLRSFPYLDGDPTGMHYCDVILGSILPMLTSKGPQLHQIVYAEGVLAKLTVIKDQLREIKDAVIPEVQALSLLAGKDAFEEMILLELVERRALVKGVDDDRRLCYLVNLPFIF